jgi:hypothetical protein
LSNKANDWATGGFTYAPAIAGPTAALVTSITGAAVDCIHLDGNMGAVQVIGTVASTSITYVGKVQEADTATGTYADIAGATFTALTSTTGAAIVNALNFQRTKRFLRYVGTIGGTTPSVSLDALFLGQNKQL